ncbi:MAG: hypothetical protein LBQ27_06690 [Clostridiales bacterium]|jgi:gas vesicle protein|nr:hypothetical protein [Clostridiales bacterium]
MAKSGIILGAIVGAAAATLIANSKKATESLIKKGKEKLKTKIDEVLD